MEPNSADLVIGIIQTVIILLASAIALYQLRISARSNRSEAYSRIGDKLQSLNELLFNNTHINEKLMLEPEAVKELIAQPENEQVEEKLIIILDMTFAYYREIFNQYARFRLINDSQWLAWKEIIRRFLKQPYARHYWDTNNWKYSKEFREQIEGILGP